MLWFYIQSLEATNLMYRSDDSQGYGLKPAEESEEGGNWSWVSVGIMTLIIFSTYYSRIWYLKFRHFTSACISLANFKENLSRTIAICSEFRIIGIEL